MHIIARLIIFCSVLTLAACGGGGSSTADSSGTPVTSSPPVASLSYSEFMNAGETVVITATATDDIGIESFSWRQSAGADVALSNINTLSVSFVAPSLVQGQTFSFDFTATDADGQSVTQVASITVNPSSSSDRAVTVTVESIAGLDMSDPNQEYLLSAAGKTVTINATSTTGLALPSSDLEVVVLTEKSSNNPILASYASTKNATLSLSVETSADVFVMKSPRFFGATITNMDELTRRIRRHTLYADLVDELKYQISINSPCPMDQSCSLNAAELSEEIAQELDLSDVIEVN